MRNFAILFVFILSLFTGSALGASRITLTVTITNTPVDGDTFVLNSDTRTWKDAVATPSTQILISTNGTGGNATNLFNHAAAYGFSGPFIPGMPATNKVSFVGQVDQAVSASITGTWAELSYSTQTVTTATTVRVPITAEPTASVRTNIASLLVSNVFNLGLSTEKILASSTALDNFVDTSENQTVAGVKTFTAANVYSNANQVFSGGSVTNAVIKTLRLNHDSANPNGIYFYTSLDGRFSAIAPDANGVPTLYGTLIDENPINELGAYTPSGGNLLTRNAGDTRYGQLGAANSWTADNTFTTITGSTIKDSTITNSTYYGTIGNLTNGTIVTPSITSGKNTGNAFQSYNGADTTTTQVGLDAAASGQYSVALGNLATASASEAIAIGKSATATHANSAAIGAATTTAASEIRIGGNSQNLAAPGNAYVGGNLVVGHANSPTLPAGLSKGLYVTNGAAATADPTAGAVVWVDTGELQYRTSASNEGSGGTQRVHNRGSQVIGSGSDFSITGTAYARADFGGQDPEISLPTAGTYLVSALVSMQSGAVANDVMHAKLFNSTDASDVTSSERTISYLPAQGSGQGQGQIVLRNIVTVTAAKTIQVYVRNETAARGSVTASKTSISYVRLY